MRKKVLMTLFIVLLFSVIPMVSLAANETSMSTIVTYTVEELATPTPTPTPTPSPTPTATPEPTPIPASPTYDINIPAAISLNEVDEIRITSDYMNLNDGQNVVVTFDTHGYNGWVDLPGTEYGSKVAFSLNRINSENGQMERIYQGDVVARFNNNTTPIEYGLLYLVPFQPDIDNAPPGTYSGTLKFNISIVD